MNFANALGFIGVGVAFVVAPFAAPALFPHQGIDGSSTRALWTGVMGLVQIGLGLTYVLSQFGRSRTTATQSPRVPAAMTEADVQTVVYVDRTPAAEPEGSVTLHGEHAELWRAFHFALRNDGQARQLAARLVALASADGDPALTGNKVVAFAPNAAEPQTDAAA
jgi:hypothetical protein